MSSFFSVRAQTFCHTPNRSNNQFLNRMMQSSSINNDSYCVKIYMHVVRRTDGSGGQTFNTVEQALEILNDDFNPHNISFNWDGIINYIDNDSYYNSVDDGVFSINNHTDGIDIYLFDRNNPGFGLANGVGEASELLVSGKFWNYPEIPLLLSHAISHEMGHILFLWHTHHGTAEGGNDNPCAELVNGNNSSSCGDYVSDTPADPNINFNTTYPNCQWTGSGTDSNGETYNPDEQNIMAYTNFSCMDYLTPLQGSRARNALATLPFLQQTVVSCCVGSDLDLLVKDSPDDDGTEPNTVTENMWTSQDIWIRNSNDNGLVHQNPEYRTNGNPNYINVRVINKSCVTSTGNETLTVNWAKANTALLKPATQFQTNSFGGRLVKEDESKQLITGNNATLNNLVMRPKESGLITLNFNFLTKELTDKTEFTYHVVQKDATTGEVIGGETFLIKKKSRPLFLADAGNDKEINENEIITISAEQINEAAVYNWYDTNGNLIYQGKDLTISSDVAKKYRLEIVAEKDGYKDYDEIEVKLKPSIIEAMSPNPVTNQMQVSYILNGVNSAYLMVIGQYGSDGASNNYLLDTESTQTTLNLSNYSNGFYSVALVCDGTIVDARTLIKQ